MQGSARPFPLIPLLAAPLNLQRSPAAFGVTLPCSLASFATVCATGAWLIRPRSRRDGEKIVVGFALHPRMQMLTQKTQHLSSQIPKAVQSAALQTQFPRPRVSGEGGQGERAGTLIVADSCRHFLG